MRNRMMWPTLYSHRLASLPDVSDEPSLVLRAGSHFAAMAFKYGQPLDLYLPADLGDGVISMLHYLHEVRQSAVQGEQIGTWSSARNMARRVVLVFWTRPSVRLKSLLRLEHHALRIVRRMPDAPTEPCTLVLDGGARLAEPAMQMGEGDRVFVHVVDGAPQVGLGVEAAHVVKTLKAICPDIPILTVGGTGASCNDMLSPSEAKERLCCLFRAHDVELLHAAMHPKQRPLALAKPTVWVLPDVTSDEHLATACQQMVQLDRLAQAEPDIAPRLLPLRRMLLALRTLAIPVTFHDAFAERNQQILPIQPIASWIDDFQIDPLDRRIGFESTRLVKMLQNYLGFLLGSGTTGRMQLLKHVVADNRNKRLLLIVDSRATADAIYEYLEAENFEVDNVSIFAGDGYQLNRTSSIDVALLLDHPSSATLHWLGLRAEQVIVPCLPFEREQIACEVSTWWQRFGTAQQDDPQKEAVLRLFFDRLDDVSGPPPRESIEVQTQSAFVGDYSRKAKVIPLELTNLADDWLARLQSAQDKMREIRVPPRRDAATGYFKIWLDGLDEPCFWPENRAVVRMLPGDTESVLPENLNIGDRLLYLPERPERLATVHSLFDLFSEHTDEGAKVLRLSGRWRRDLRNIMSRQEGSGIYRKLAAAGLKVKETTVESWLRTDDVIGPQYSTDILAIGRVKNESDPEAYAGAIRAAVGAVRKRQSRIAEIIEQAVRARAAGYTDISVGERRLDASALDLLFRVFPIAAISPPDDISHDSGGLDLIGKVSSICADYPRQLKLQPSALRSLRQSPFRNLDKIDEILRFIAEFVHPHLAGGLPGKEVLEGAQRIGAEYCPNTSSSTMGRFRQQYERIYDGKTVTIGAHVGYGKARNPVQTLRVHYHFDLDQNLVVIHHIGKHLDTTQT